MKFLRLFLFLAAGLVLPAAADQVELTDGSLIKGKIIAVDAGKLKIETTFVGTVSIDLGSVARFKTDEPVHISVAGSPSLLSRVESSGAGVRVAADGINLAAAPGQVTSLWRQGAASPVELHGRELAEKARRKWSYEASAAVTGRTGASEKFNAALGFKATLASSHDRLILAANSERAEDTGVRTTDRNSAGVDYSSFYSPEQGWYVRSSLESDKVKALDLRSTSALGFTHKLVRRSSLDLEVRAGGSYLYENYSTGTQFESPGLDFAALSTYTFGGAKLSTTLSYAPTFRDYSNYRVRHESALEVPLNVSLWKLKLGLMNEYQSVSPAGVDKFDTTYFTSLLLNWK